MGALKQGALADTFKRFPGAATLLKPVFRGKLAKLTADARSNEDAAVKLVDRRIQMQKAADEGRRAHRRDFMTRILEQRDPKEVSDLQLAAHASDFVLAGSETTATAMGAITYYLLRPENAAVRKALEDEIRGAFARYEDIDSQATIGLTYLRLVILEGLRMYPPLPLGLPRVVPEGGDVVDGHFLPAGVIVYTSPIAANMDPANFSDPECFRPERWATGPSKTDKLEAAQPFSLGARGCLGRK
jgi:cytochrome P450